MRRLLEPLTAAPLLLACAALAGCGSSVGLEIPAASDTAMSSGYGSSSGGSGAASAPATAGTSATSGMDMASGISTSVPEVNGVAPVASKVLATADWQGMEIQARTMTPTPFLIDNGTSPNGTLQLKLVKPPKHSSFHLMIMLSQRQTGAQIAYAGVWAAIDNSAGKQVWASTLWAMNSAYMGVHYGDNVPHLAPGHYTLKLLITPPAQARHIEYEHVWLHQFSVTERFTWNPSD